ncbi:MAG: DUF2314 domain-containing protein, partial [Verrucomicrobiota bacterium]
SEDPQLTAAAEMARNTFKFLWRELAWERRRIVPGLDLACVKLAFADGPDSSVEHMWISDVDFDGAAVRGTLINEPNWLTSVKQGDVAEAPLSEIGDWMYAVNSRVYGAYTVNLMRSQMAPAERAQHDEAWGLDFGDPNQIELVPANFYGSEKKSGFIGKLFGKKQNASPEDSTPIEEREHPMSENMRPSLEEHLAGDPSAANSPDDNGWTFLHHQALAGSAASVEVLLNHGADVNMSTSSGLTPLSLAKSLGWPRVEKLLVAAGGQ